MKLRITTVGIGTMSAAPIVFGMALAVLPAAAQPYELPPQLLASEILPDELLRGPDFTVREAVSNDGLVNHYMIDSSFGTFSAATTLTLRKRVGEVLALRQMEAVRQSDIFRKSLAQSGKDTVNTVVAVVEHPVGTVTGAFSGIGKAFTRAGEGLFGSRRSEAEDNAFESLIGLSKTKRDYAHGFGVDVYTDNEVLQHRLDELARASYAGGLTYSAALSLVPGGAGVALSITGGTQLANDIYRTNAPADLRRGNREKLEAMGMREAAIHSFMDNAKYSPREQTELVRALERLPASDTRELFVVLAGLTDDRDMAAFRQRQATMYAGYHETIGPIASFVALGEFVAARTAQGIIVFNLPVDHLVWTEWMAAAVDGVDQHLAAMAGTSGKELVLAGTLSPLALESLTRSGWKVRSSVEDLAIAP